MKIKNLVKSAYSISLEEDISKSVLLVHDVNETHVKTCILYQSTEKISRSVFCLALLFEIKTGKSKKKNGPKCNFVRMIVAFNYLDLLINSISLH